VRGQQQVEPAAHGRRGRSQPGGEVAGAGAGVRGQRSETSRTPQDPGEAAGHARRFLEILGLDGRPDLAALRAVPAGQLLAASQQLAWDTFRPGSAAPPMYPVLGSSGIPEPWQQALAARHLDGKPLLTGTTRDEMAAFAALDPRIQADVEAATRLVFRDGTLAIAGHHAGAGHPAYVTSSTSPRPRTRPVCTTPPTRPPSGTSPDARTRDALAGTSAE